MRIEKLLKTIENVLPEYTAMEGDKIGLQIQSGRKNIDNILVTLEIDEQVIDEAVKLKSDCIITFHPLIYSPLTFINDNDRVGKLITKIISNSIALISIHTNFDAFAQGTSFILAKKLNLNIIDFLIPNKLNKTTGIGVLAKTKRKLSEEILLNLVQSICFSPIRYNHGRSTKGLEKIAIIGGSGSSFINYALESEAHVFITADITYHTFHKVNGKLMLIDPGHYEMEQFVPEGLVMLLKDKLPKNEYNKIIQSKRVTNPVCYYPGNNKYATLQKQYLIKNNKTMVN